MWQLSAFVHCGKGWCGLYRKSPEQAARRARGFVNQVGLLAVPSAVLGSLEHPISVLR